MKKGSTTELGSRSRRRILEHTIKLVGERGIKGTSVNLISKEVGIAKTAIYWHFESKAGLMAAVIETVTGEWIEEVNNYSKAGTPIERKQRLLDSFRDIIENRPNTLRVLLAAVMETNTVAPEIREGVLRATDATIDAIGKGFEESLGTKLPDVEFIGHTVLAMLEATLRRRLMEPDCDLEPHIKEIGLVIDLVVTDRLRRLSKTS